MFEPILYINQGQLSRLKRTFELGEEFEDKFANLMVFVGSMIRDQAQNASKAVSSRVSASIEMDIKTKADGEIVVGIGSTFQGYPTSSSDTVGDARMAASKGWATFAHRIHYGYSGSNPRAGFTAPTPFLVPFFEHGSESFFDTVQNLLLRRVLRGY